eukprot:EC826107.1.p1 GENE.EC826107.1~~EC826107.1.p1  ORF type:complete len:153 (+),score=70.28 EC826107.1:49-459(+)
MHNVGVCYCLSASVGGVYGIMEGLIKGEKGSIKLRTNSVLNHLGKRGITFANTTGVAVLLFNTIELGLNKITEKENDLTNSLISGTVSGVLLRSFKATPRALIVGGSGGFLMSLAYTIFKNRINPFKFIKDKIFKK